MTQFQLKNMYGEYGARSDNGVANYFYYYVASGAS